MEIAVEAGLPLAPTPTQMTLLLQARVVHDTIFVQTAPIAQTWFGKVTSIAGGIMTLTLLAMAIALVPAAWNFRKTYKKTTQLLETIQADVMPLMKHAHSIADNMDYISTAIRADVGMIQDTLKSANRTIREAVGVTEQKVNEFNALLDVVQGEAEGLFVSTAAAVRGVKTGASHLVGGAGTEIASVEVDGDDLEIVVDDEETDDYGYDDSPESDDQPDATRAPRIIRRDRSRR
jgi:hypothetical protein